MALLHLNRHNKTESAIFVSFDVFLASRGSSFRTYFDFTAAGVAAVKRLPVHHYSADYNFQVLWDHWTHSESV